MNSTKTAFLGTPGYVPNPYRFSNADLMKAVGANSGNLLFQLAATRLVGGHLEHIGFSGKPYDDGSVFAGLNFFVFPAANHLRSDANWDLLTKFLRTIRVPLIVFGLGAQADHGASVAGTARDIKANASVMQFVDLLRDKAVLITVRGPFTEAVCQDLGLKNVLRIGCPSQFLNPDPALGKAIATQLKAAQEASVTTLALTALAPNEVHGWRQDVEAKLFRWLVENGGLYIQQSCEEDLFGGPEGRLDRTCNRILSRLHAALAPDSTSEDFVDTLAEDFRIFFDANRWIGEIGGVQLAIGTRIHGNMVALAASRPGIVIAHDARVGELADEMHIPKVHSDAVLQSSDIKGVIGKVEFDAAAFDSARRQKAQILRAALEQIGLTPSHHLKALGGGAEQLTQVSNPV